MTIGLLGVAVLLLGGLFVLGLAGYERRGRHEIGLALVVGAVLVESLLFPTQAEMAVGIFRPGPLRLSELLIVAVLFARLLGRPAATSTRISGTAICWILFLVWYGATAVTGYLGGNRSDLLLFQGKALLYLGGGYALAAGIPSAAVVARRAWDRWFLPLSAIVAVLVVTSVSGIGLFTSIPGVGPVRLGLLGSDTASVLAALGVVAFLVEASRAERRPLRLFATVPFLLTPFAAEQRAAVVGVVVAVALVAAAAVLPTWRRRIRVTFTEIALGTAGIAVAAGLLFLATGQSPEDNVATDLYENTFTDTENRQSADTRLVLWAEGSRLFWERPLIGWGMGKDFNIRRAGTGEQWEAGGFHNIVYDLLVRSGVVGLLLFVTAMAATAYDASRVWRRHPDGRVAAAALAGVAVIAGLLAKGSFESILEKSRLAIVIGLLAGVIASAVSELRRPRHSWLGEAPEEALAAERDHGLSRGVRVTSPW